MQTFEMEMAGELLCEGLRAERVTQDMLRAECEAWFRKMQDIRYQIRICNHSIRQNSQALRLKQSNTSKAYFWSRISEAKADVAALEKELALAAATLDRLKQTRNEMGGLL